jgi:hypothetical protein
MVRRDFLGWSLRNCKRAVDGVCGLFRVFDQGVRRRWRPRRTHQRCIASEDYSSANSVILDEHRPVTEPRPRLIVMLGQDRNPNEHSRIWQSRVPHL